MANLRLKTYKVVDSTHIELTFTESLASTVGINNIEIISDSVGVPNATVTKATVSGDTLKLVTLPITPFGVYNLRMYSNGVYVFRSVNGNVLLEDGKTNIIRIIGPNAPENDFVSRCFSYLKKNPYRPEKAGYINTFINALSDLLYKTQNNIHQAKSDNYISITVNDEYHKRGAGPFDRLSNEGAFEIIRVGPKPASFLGDGYLSIDTVTTLPIPLQARTITGESLTASNTASAGTFSGQVCTLSYSNVTKIKSITITYTSTGQILQYDIQHFGYQLLESRYDKYASDYATLQSNQFRISDKFIREGYTLPKVGDRITVTYDYKDLSIDIDPTSIVVYEVKQAIRNVCPPIANMFFLQHSNIVNSSGTFVSTGAVSFLDPQSTPPFSATHPAFTKELVYTQNTVPSSIGAYTIDYRTGKVLVYGADTTSENQGSGIYPPACTYYYKEVYKDTIDYTYDSGLKELAARSTRDLIDKTNVYIYFKYTYNYVDGVDYVAQIHKEAINERINNRLIGANTIETENTPITNVFRIYNETSGEIYRLNYFTDNKVVFNYNTPPTLLATKQEKASFAQYNNEFVIINDRITNTNGIDVVKCNLAASPIIGSTEDCIGCKYNTSLYFDRKDIFVKELYYNELEDSTTNIDRITLVGQYVVDYENSIIYVGIEASQTDDLGLVSYKADHIVPIYPHVISVDKMYSIVNGSTVATYDYSSFEDANITLLDYKKSNIRYLDEDETLPILVSSNTINLPENALSIRGVYEAYDLATQDDPINFGIDSTVYSGAYAILAPVSFKFTSTVKAGNTVDVDRLISNSNLSIDSVSYIKKTSDNTEVYNTTLSDGSFTGYTITLPTDTTASVGDEVEVTIYIELNDNSAVVIDTDLGGILLDYTSVYDEILISYEYGDNCLDFRQSQTVSADNEYYVSYKYGALRDSLLNNFGSIINIDEFRNLDIDTERERYREALTACLQNFPKGPTKTAISSIAQIMSHVEPDISESLFEEWILGLSHLYRTDPLLGGTPSVMQGKLGPGVYFENSDHYLEIPFSSRFKLDGGTLEFWVTPNWDGLDNDATLTFSITKDGYTLSTEKIFIGASAYNPTLDIDEKFYISKFDTDSIYGIPYTIASAEDGVFIYLDRDDNRFKVYAKDKTTDEPNYIITIQTTGEFYNVTQVGNSIESNDRLTTSKNMVVFNCTFTSGDDSGDGIDGYSVDGYALDGYSFDGISFFSGDEHYLFDYGYTEDENRLSIYKDSKGYLVLRAISHKDRLDKPHIYQLSHDIVDWAAGDNHHIAVSHKISSIDKNDELHLFIDGAEVPNCIRYGSKPAFLSDGSRIFRTVIPEIVAGTIPKTIVGGVDLATTAGSDIIVSSGSDFGAANVSIGDPVYIDESGFDEYYLVTEVIDFNTLRLDQVMPATLSNAAFSVNKWTAPVSTDLMYESNLMVTRYDGYSEVELPGLRATNPAYAIDVDGYGQSSIVIRDQAEAGDQIYIRTLGMNRRRVRERLYVWSDIESFINSNLPPPINLDYVKIIPVTKLRYIVNSSRPSVGNSDGYIVISGSDISVTGITPDTQPSNSITGRTLNIYVSMSSNVNTAIPCTIVIDGYGFGATPLSETITYSSSGLQSTTNYFTEITAISAYGQAINTAYPIFSFEIKENQINVSENNATTNPVIRYSLHESGAKDLTYIDASTASSAAVTFYNSHVGKSIVITSPVGVAGTYTITSVIDTSTITVSPDFSSSFTNGEFGIYDISISRSGFANGMFTFEVAGNTPTPFYLKKGYYDFDYFTPLYIPFDIKAKNMVFGNSYDKSKPARAIIDGVRVLCEKLTDVRVGEQVISNVSNITSDYLNSIKFTPDKDTLMLLDLNSSNEIIDYSNVYKRFDGGYFQSSTRVNSSFGRSLAIASKGFEIDNNRIISGNSGTIEFWVNPSYDSRNDSVNRYLFDANSYVVEELISTTKTTIDLTHRAGQIISVQLATDTTTTGTNYATGGSLSNDKLSIRLGKALPYAQTPVKVIYSPYGVVGNRISIYKDSKSILNFAITSNDRVYRLATPIFWQSNTWHRVMATWDLTKPRAGEMHLFVDGEEKVIISAGSFISGSGVFSANVTYNNNRTLNVQLQYHFQKLYIGSNYLLGEISFGLINNLKISSVKKQPISILGQPFDNDYCANIDAALPVIEDLYTTYIMNFDDTYTKVTDFAILHNKEGGSFDFTLNVIDSFGIIDDSVKAKDLLEKMIEVLKPANSRGIIKYS